MSRFLAAAAAVLMAGPAFADISITTARGPAEVPEQPERVAVFDLAALDTLDALGVMPVGIPTPIALPYLSDVVEQVETAGTLFEPDLEILNALEPDLIIVGGRTADQLDSVSRVGTAVDMTIEGTDFLDTALARLDTYGELFGKQDEAATIHADLEAKRDALHAASEGKGSALIILTNGPKMSAYGIGSRFGWMHEVSGLPQAVEGLDTATHGEAISSEFIRNADPEWLIVVDRAAAIGSEEQRATTTLDNELVRETRAWKDGHIVYVNAADAYVAGGGVQALSNVMDTLTEAMKDGSDS